MKHPIFHFLASMKLAIALLLLLAIASVIGTFIQQNQPYIDYSLKFGVFWFELFRSLGLYDVYGEPWFLFIIAFLLISVSSCLTKQIPIILRHTRKNAADKQWSMLLKSPNSWEIKHTLNGDKILRDLRQDGLYRSLKDTVTFDAEGNPQRMISGRRGRYQPIGYLFTHISIVVICLGALMDSSITVKMQQWQGLLKPETENIPLSEIGEQSWLESDTFSFRGTVNIPEGKVSNVVFLPWQEGYLVQKLPFYVQLDDFRIEHYPTGQPKSFESDLSILSLDGTLNHTATISVNHPLTVDGITIYQSSFSDGGSELKLLVTNLDDFSHTTINMTVHENTILATSSITIEALDFRLFNIQPLEHDTKKFRNQGPSFRYKLRDQYGNAIEYQNFVAPIEVNGTHYYLSGVKKNPQEDFSYLQVPLDENLTINSFIKFLSWLKDDKKLDEIFAQSSLKSIHEPSIESGLFASLIKSFIENGLPPADFSPKDIETAEEQKAFRETMIQLTTSALFEVYLAMIQENQTDNISAQQEQFFDDSLISLISLTEYVHPFLFQLKAVDHIQSSGLQMTKSYGKFLIYLGFGLLLIGLFVMFYVPNIRLLICIRAKHTIINLDLQKNNINKQRERDRIDQLLR